VMTRWIETASTASREGDGFTRSETPSSASSSRFARSSSPSVSCDAGEVVHHLLAARIAFRLRVRQTMIENRILQPELRRTGTTIEPAIFSRAGAVARFAFRRGHDTPPGEPRRSTSPSGARLASRCFPLRVVRVSGSRRLFAFAPSLRHACLRRDAPGLTPDCAAFVDGAHHFFTTCRLATTRRAIMASDVGRGLREAPCREREGPVCAHSSREWNTAGAPPRGRPRTLSVVDLGA